MKLITNGRYAAVASTAALVVALGGTSYAAAGLINGGDIKNGSVTSADVKNHNLKLKDFSSGAQAGLHGATGATGPQGPAGQQGPQGATGAQGPMGPSNAYSVWNDAGTTINGTTKTVLTLSVQPGSYVVNSKGWVTGSYAACYLAGGGQIDYNIGSGNGTVANQLVFSTNSATNVTLNCYGNGGLYWKKLTAIKVSTVSNNQGPDIARTTAGVQGLHR